MEIRSQVDNELLDTYSFFGCCNKVTHPGRLKTTENLFSHSSRGQESKLRYGQNWFLLEALREKTSHAFLLVSGGSSDPYH